MGGLAIHDPTTPERVELKKLEGLIPPWKVIDQKGASQDGVSFVDALYDPIEVGMDVEAVGRDPAHLRMVVRDLLASIDVKKEAELSFFTQYLGRWWAPVRWFKTPSDAVGPIASRRQRFTLQLRSDLGFWQSYPHIDQFRFTYENDNETFNFFTALGDPLPGWTLVYSGSGSGFLYADGAQALSTFANNRSVVARRDNFIASTDNVVVEIELGTNAQPTWPKDTYFDVWGRMGNAGTPGSDGVRFRISLNKIRVSSFSGGIEHLMREVPHIIPSRPGEKYKFIFGQENEPRTFKMMRANATFLTVKEVGTSSVIDSAHRKAGFGMATLAGSVRPLAIRNWSVGDNTTVVQEGFVERVNVGDQPMWDRFTCFGPGTFYLGNGPSSTDLVKFGPLLPNQIMQVRTDPRKRGVVDMTAIPPTPQEVAMFRKASLDFFSFFSLGNIPTSPAITSIFGIAAPQGNPYSLLNGRFSVPIPPRSPGAPVQPYHVKVKIDNGNSDSQIIAAGTPLRRLPY